MIFKENKNRYNLLKNKKKRKNKLKKYLFLVIGCFLTAFAFNVFFSPNNIVTGGVSGVSIVVKKVFGIPTTTFISITYILLLILSYIILGKKLTKNSLIGSLVYPLFVYLTEGMANAIAFNVDNTLLIVIFGALVNGLGGGLVFKYGFSTGGSDVICLILSKLLKISIGTAVKIVNTIIIIGAGFFIGGPGVFYAWENVMYAMIAIYIISLLNDKVILGVSNSKSFYVITEHETSIKEFLTMELGRGVTVLEGRGGFTGDRKKVIMCAIPTKQYFLAKEGILALDKDAIILINDVYQSAGLE